MALRKNEVSQFPQMPTYDLEDVIAYEYDRLTRSTTPSPTPKTTKHQDVSDKTPTPERKDGVGSASRKNAVPTDDWYLRCSYGAYLCIIKPSQELDECGLRAHACVLHDGEYYSPVLRMENLTGQDQPEFQVDYTIDGYHHGHLNAESISRDSYKLFWFHEKPSILCANYGIHTIVYSINGTEVCTFTWEIENDREYSWIEYLSCAASLKVCTNNQFVRNSGLVGELSTVTQTQYYCPSLQIKNLSVLGLPDFEIKCIIDGTLEHSWKVTKMIEDEYKHLVLSEGVSRGFMTLGKHSIVYTMNSLVVCKLQWEIVP